MTGSIVNYKIIVKKDTIEIAEHFSKLLIEKVKKNRGKFSLALSGGSTPAAIFKYLAENHSADIDWEDVLLFWGDERCVQPNSDESNYKMAYDNLISQVDIPINNVFRIRGENDPEEEAEYYSNLIRNKVKKKHKLPRFDLIMLGLGTDGHTASIFPDQKKLLHSENICEAATHPESGQNRITLTGTVINNAATIIFLVQGKSKKNIVSKILSSSNDRDDYPASYISPVKGELIWLLDEKAAELIS